MEKNRCFCWVEIPVQIENENFANRRWNVISVELEVEAMETYVMSLQIK